MLLSLSKLSGETPMILPKESIKLKLSIVLLQIIAVDHPNYIVFGYRWPERNESQWCLRGVISVIHMTAVNRRAFHHPLGAVRPILSECRQYIVIRIGGAEAVLIEVVAQLLHNERAKIG